MQKSLELPSQDLQLVLRKVTKKRQTASERRLLKTRSEFIGSAPKSAKIKGNDSST
jgi:hypothetical protein